MTTVIVEGAENMGGRKVKYLYVMGWDDEAKKFVAMASETWVKPIILNGRSSLEISGLAEARVFTAVHDGNSSADLQASCAQPPIELVLVSHHRSDVRRPSQMETLMWRQPLP